MFLCLHSTRARTSAIKFADCNEVPWGEAYAQQRTTWLLEDSIEIMNDWIEMNMSYTKLFCRPNFTNALFSGVVYLHSDRSGFKCLYRKVSTTSEQWRCLSQQWAVISSWLWWWLWYDPIRKMMSFDIIFSYSD